MAGDTPTPIRQNKEGTAFYGNDVEIDLHKGNESLEPYDQMYERRNVESAFASAAFATPEVTVTDVEFNLEPITVAEVARITQELLKARAFDMDPAFSEFLREDRAA